MPEEADFPAGEASLRSSPSLSPPRTSPPSSPPALLATFEQLVSEFLRREPFGGGSAPAAVFYSVADTFIRSPPSGEDWDWGVFQQRVAMHCNSVLRQTEHLNEEGYQKACNGTRPFGLDWPQFQCWCQQFDLIFRKQYMEKPQITRDDACALLNVQVPSDGIFLRHLELSMKERTRLTNEYYQSLPPYETRLKRAIEGTRSLEFGHWYHLIDFFGHDVALDVGNGVKYQYRLMINDYIDADDDPDIKWISPEDSTIVQGPDPPYRESRSSFILKDRDRNTAFLGFQLGYLEYQLIHDPCSEWKNTHVPVAIKYDPSKNVSDGVYMINPCFLAGSSSPAEETVAALEDLGLQWIPYAPLGETTSWSTVTKIPIPRNAAQTGSNKILVAYRVVYDEDQWVPVAVPLKNECSTAGLYPAEDEGSAVDSASGPGLGINESATEELAANQSTEAYGVGHELAADHAAARHSVGDDLTMSPSLPL